MRRVAGFAAGFFVGGSVFAGCGGLNTDALAACVYEPGTAQVTMRSLEGTYPNRTGGIRLVADGPGDCSRYAVLAHAIAVQVRCDPGHPVKHCELSGACLDEATGDLFACQGDLWFE